MKIYTKTGDNGTTSLCNGERISKTSPRICVQGDIDELSSTIGLAISFSYNKKLKNILYEIQHDLFLLASYISACNKDLPEFNENKIKKLELIIDETTKFLKPLRSFILPGGTKVASALHLARTICRRTERNCINLSKTEKVFKLTIPYLNRLSDLLFTLARKSNKGRDILV